jgi:CBS domain-containing protein
MATKSVGEIMTRKLEKINSSATAQEVAKKMSEIKVSSLLVTDDTGTPIGIVTEGNLVRKVIADKFKASAVNVQQVMFSPPVTIDPNSSMEIAADIMNQNKVKHLLVVENEDLNKPLGIISATDFAGYLKDTAKFQQNNQGN